MAVTDFFVGEITTELLKNLIAAISLKSCNSRGTAEELKTLVEQLLPIIQEIKHSGVELPAERQFQLDRMSEVLQNGLELVRKVLTTPRWNFYTHVRLAKKMEALETTVSRFLQGPLQVHILADVHHIRAEVDQRFDRLDWSNRVLEQRLGTLKIGTCGGGGVGGGWMEEAVRRVEEEGQMKWEVSSSVVLGLGVGMKTVKGMIFGREDLRVVGICGIGGSGKTTLARELCKDAQVRSYFSDRILFLTVSQSPDVNQLKAKIVQFIMGNQVLSPNSVLPQWNLQYEWITPTKTLVVLDDVWSLAVLEPLLFNIPGCKFLVVSRFKFPTVLNATYDVELLREEEALSLFCHSAFGQKSIPPAADKNLVKQIVNECKRLPLALKVIGASLKDQGPNLGKGFFQSFTAAIWRNQPPENRLPPPNEGDSIKSGPSSNHDSSKGGSEGNKALDHQVPEAIEIPPNPVQSTPPPAVKIGNDPHKKAEPEKPNKPEVKEEVSKPPQDADKSKKPAHMKRISSVGLQVESVLGRKTGNIKDVYSLGRKLGQGQFGTTFLCVEKETNKEFACKSIAKRKLTTQEDVEDVRREIQIMHHLAGHPNVIQIISAYEDAVAVHVVMELCAGGELFDRIIQRGHYTERKAAKLARVIAGVLEACHSLGVMHRDLKPENFLFVNQKEDAPLKTIDFGLSVFFRPGETFTDVVGSPYYVAPEVLRKHYGLQCDVWSAGVIIYILLSGVPPFWDETEHGIFEQVLKGELDFISEPWPSISESAKDLVRRMLVRDPKKRLTAHEVLCHPWVQIDGAAPDKPLDSAVLTRLKQFSAMNKLKKIAIRVIAESLSEEEIAGLKEMFRMIDADNSGHITLEELKNGLERVGADVKDSEISWLMQAADVDNSGTIDYGEFIAAMLHLNKVQKEDHLYAAFSYFDTDGSGHITRDELQQACEKFGLEDVHLDDIIREVDQDNDGRIDYSEFVAMMQDTGFGKGLQSNMSRKVA